MKETLDKRELAQFNFLFKDLFEQKKFSSEEISAMQKSYKVIQNAPDLSALEYELNKLSICILNHFHGDYSNKSVRETITALFNSETRKWHFKKAVAEKDTLRAVRTAVHCSPLQQMLFWPEYAAYLDAFVSYGHEFYPENISGFVAVATPEQISIFSEMGYLLNDEQQLQLIKRQNFDLVHGYMTNNPTETALCDAAEIALLEEYPLDKAAAYFRILPANRLTPSGEKWLFNNQKFEHLKSFIEARGNFRIDGLRSFLLSQKPELEEIYFYYNPRQRGLIKP